MMRVVFCLTFAVLIFAENVVQAQTDLHISGPQAGFPIAIPKLCALDVGSETAYVEKIPEQISKNLQLTGLFRLLDPSSFVETPGKCSATSEFAFSDWSVIGADWLVRGEVTAIGDDQFTARLYLHDIVNKKAVLGKQYNAPNRDLKLVADKFSNDILELFTGSKGIFGTKIVYVSKVGRFKELFIVDIDGSNPRQLTQDRGLALSPAWSPAGDRILFTSYRTKQPELYVISPNGGNPTQITKRPGLELGAEFAPDGKSILSSASIAGDSHLVYFDFRGSILQQVTHGPSLNVSPSYSPDGRSIAFCSSRSGGPQIYVMDPLGGEAKRISFTTSNYCTSPAWSPRSEKGDEKIAFVCRYDGGFNLFISNPDGRNVSQLTFAGNNEDPSWSPDGNFLAYSSSVGGARNIYILSLLSGATKQVTFSRTESSQPAWSNPIE